MIRQIAPQFFSTDIPATLAYYKDKLGFECLGTWQDPPVYAIVARDRHAIHFRCAAPPAANPDKYSGELLDAYTFEGGNIWPLVLLATLLAPRLAGRRLGTRATTR